MLNKAILMGRLTRDPELRYTQTNVPVCSFSIAVDRNRKAPNGDKQTDFFNCVTWNKQAEFVSQWFTKGMLAIVVGRIEPRQWQDKNGNNRISVEIQCEEVSFGETKKSREANMATGSGAPDLGSASASYSASANVPPASSDSSSHSAAADTAPVFGDLPPLNPDFQDYEDDDKGVPF